MSPEAEYLVADGLLKSSCEGKRDDHDHHADHGRTDGQPDHEARKRSLLVEGDPIRNKSRNVQSEKNLEAKIDGFMLLLVLYVL